MTDELELCCKIEDKRAHRYRFIDSEKEHCPLSLLCRVMRVTRSAYYVYARGKSHVLNAAKDEVAEQVEAAYHLHRRRYGARRLAADLKPRGVRVGRFQVKAMMRRQNLVAIQPRCFTPPSTDSRHTVQASLNLLLELENSPRQPREVVVGDITYLPSLSGKRGYLASWQDKFSERIVGWAVEEWVTDELVTKPLRRRSKAEE